MIYLSDLVVGRKAKVVWIHPGIMSRLVGKPIRYNSKIVKVEPDVIECNGQAFGIDSVADKIGVQVIEDKDE